LSVWALTRYRRRLAEKVSRLRQRSADIGTFLIETLQGMKLVVTSNAQEREAARFRRKNEGFMDALSSMQLFSYLAGGIPGLILSAGTAAVFLYGGLQVIGGSLSMGTFVAFMAYQMRLLPPIQALMGLYASLATARVSIERVQQILDTPPEVVERPDAAVSEGIGHARKPPAMTCQPRDPVRSRVLLEGPAADRDVGERGRTEHRVVVRGDGEAGIHQRSHGDRVRTDDRPRRD